jgi:two-component system, NarL family, response regulator LiaR
MAIRVLITDDHGVVRQGLRMFLSLDPDIEVVGEAENGEEALSMVRELHPNVVLMDLLMPVMNGMEATKAIRSEMPDVEVIALTSVLEDISVTGVMRAGALGYLLKDAQVEELHRAIRGAAEGRVQLAPEAVVKLISEVSAPENPEELTDRDIEVLKLLARGKANKQIASDLFIDEKAVRTNVSSILRKLGVRSRTQAALHAVRTGLVSIEELSEESW